MDIAALSMGCSQMNLHQQTSISIMKMAMDTGKTQMKDMVQMVEQNTKIMAQSIKPHLGSNVDISL